jgi:hypothetical protein
VKIEPRLPPPGSFWGPVHDYHVIFWRQPRVSDSDRPDGVTQERVVWAADENDVRDAADVHEAIAWADEEARRRRAAYTLYALIRMGDEEGRVWIGGVNPTTSGRNFERRQPSDVDPVWGSPTDAYGSGQAPR